MMMQLLWIIHKLGSGLYTEEETVSIVDFLDDLE